MNKRTSWVDVLLQVASYVLVAAVAATVAIMVYSRNVAREQHKLVQLEELILNCFVDEKDQAAMEDAAAAAMVDSLGDRWSYYIPASEYAAFTEQKANSYVGVGITISVREDGVGFDILKVEPGGPAAEAGLLPGDILLTVSGQQVTGLGTDGARDLLVGEPGSTVSLTVLREEVERSFTVERRQIKTAVATGVMLEDGIGLVTIANFNDRCSAEAIAAIEDLLEQGATALIFDVRGNPGGYKHELVKLLDYLLPEGPLFRSVDYTGKESVDKSDARCLEKPMAVLVNGGSYSAAEFFAAALEEYDWAVVVGEQTSGKGHYQNTFELNDGSGVGLSVGRYCTPNGVDLEGVGITPEIRVEVDSQTAGYIASGLLEPGEDPQIQAAVAALRP